MNGQNVDPVVTQTKICKKKKLMSITLGQTNVHTIKNNLQPDNQNPFFF